MWLITTRPDMPPAHVEALEEPVPVREVTFRLRRQGATTRVRLVRANVSLNFAIEDVAIRVTVPRIDAHELIVFEGNA
jgi:hypothetical protein